MKAVFAPLRYAHADPNNPLALRSATGSLPPHFRICYQYDFMCINLCKTFLYFCMVAKTILKKCAFL